MNYYTILGVDRNASQDTIKQAYRAKAKIYHPDVIGTGDATVFKQIAEAYEVLSNQEARLYYDFGWGTSYVAPASAPTNPEFEAYKQQRKKEYQQDERLSLIVEQLFAHGITGLLVLVFGIYQQQVLWIIVGALWLLLVVYQGKYHYTQSKTLDLQDEW